MMLNSVKLNPVIYFDSQNSKTTPQPLKKEIKVGFWDKHGNQIRNIVFKLYSLALGCFQKMKSFGLKIGPQIRFAVIYIDKAIVVNIHVHHHHYPVEIKKEKLQKCEEPVKESTLVEAKKIDMLKAESQPSLASF